ncbi:MAG: hypothetical protein AAGH19_11100 [Pseudomonadota bacterium]
MRRFLIAVLTLSPIIAAANESVLEALASTSGRWTGELYYLDYQSGDRFSIPMDADIEVTPDGATVIRRLTWTDPGNLVYAVQLTTVDRDTGELVDAYFRDGRGEHLRYVVSEYRYESPTKWRVVYEHEGQDADRPAQIRHTLTSDGELLTSKKSVKFLDADDTAFIERNGSELRRIEAMPN